MRALIQILSVFHITRNTKNGMAVEQTCFVLGENLLIDFSKVRGGISNAGGQAKLTNYLMFEKGSLQRFVRENKSLEKLSIHATQRTPNGYFSGQNTSFL